MIEKENLCLLHIHSYFSTLDGLSPVKDMAELISSYGMKACAITDHGNMVGHAAWSKACQEAGIKPIFGEEFYIVPEGETIDQKDQEHKTRYHITVIAKNQQGYKNLCKLSTTSYLDGFYYKPRIDLSLLKKHHEGLVVLSGCFASQLSYYLSNNELEKAKEYAKGMKEIFGEDFYTEQVWLRPTGKVNPRDKIEGVEPIYIRQEKVNELSTKLAKELGIKRVLTTDSHYLRSEDQEAHETLICIGTAQYLDDPDRWSFCDIDESIPTPEEMIAHCKDDLEPLLSQKEIMDKCNVDIQVKEPQSPHFPTPNGQSEIQYLRELVYKKCKEKNYELTPKVIERLKKEMTDIEKVGMAGYFLVVQDYVNWAKENNILVGPGRGSAAGSLVCYLLGITGVDPMQYEDLMIWERFINVERVSMPDVDMDFSDRQKVEDYFKERWGKENTSAVQTVQYMRAKQAFKDTARTLKIDFQTSNKIASLIPDFASEDGRGKKLPGVVQTVKEIQKLIAEDENIKRAFEIAIKLEGTIRGFGVHACAVVVSQNKLDDCMGLALSKEGRVVTQCDPRDLEEVYGLWKMDFLGLNNLTIMQNTIDFIKQNRGESISLMNIPMDDKETFEKFSKGRSKFTFQFNTGYGRECLTEFGAKSVKDLSFLTAVLRPGPMSKIPDMVKVAKGVTKPYYFCKEAEEIFGPTYGFPVYQEQVMNFSRSACGFTMGEADKLRKAMGKSSPEQMKSYKDKFVQGCKKFAHPIKEGTKIQDKDIEELWDLLMEFAKYSFNGSHSIAYSYISYWTCYFLTHYPEEYLAATINERKDDKDLINEIIRYAREEGIRVESPDIRYPEEFCVPVPKEHKIVYGMFAVKGLGKSAKDIKALIAENGVPETLGEFLILAKQYKITSNKLEALIYSGALDTYGLRSVLHANKEAIIEFLRNSGAKKKNAKQTSLFEMENPQPDLSIKPQKSNDLILELLFKERDYLGSFITRHPLELYEQNPQWAEQSFLSLKSKDSWKPVVDKVIGIVLTPRRIMTKKNQAMMFLTVDCSDYILDLTIFPATFSSLSKKPEKNDIVTFSYRPESYDKENKTITGTIERIRILS